MFLWSATCLADFFSLAEGPHRRTFTWENINYHVPVPGGTRRLLHDVSGYVKPGTVTALMGASGAGMACLDGVVDVR